MFGGASMPAARRSTRRRKLARWRCTKCKWTGIRGLTLRYCPRCVKQSVVRDEGR